MNEIAPGIWVGRLATRAEQARCGIRSVVELAPELPCRNDAPERRSVAMLDLVAPGGERLDQAVRAIEALDRYRPTLICCALGYSRSAAAAAAFLLARSAAPSVEAAIAQVEARRRVVLKPSHRAMLQEWSLERLTHA